jgi:hypothetical protein
MQYLSTALAKKVAQDETFLYKEKAAHLSYQAAAVAGSYRIKPAFMYYTKYL